MRGAEASGGAERAQPSARASLRRVMPRIGIVAGCRFPSPRGSQVLIDAMAAALAASGVETHLLAPIAGPWRSSYRTHSLASARTMPVAEPSLGSAAGRLLRDPGLASRLARIVARERIEVLHAHNYEALIASLCVRAALGVPVVFHAHAVLADELPLYAPPGALGAGAARRLGAWCDARLPRLADHVVALSGDVARYMGENGVAPHKLSTIPPGVAAAAPAPVARPRSARPQAVFAGNLDRYQNLDLLLDAWAIVAGRMADAELLLVTHESQRAPGLGAGPVLPRVGIVRAKDFGEARAATAGAWVGVSPRTSWSGFPIKTLNYMAAALPTVAMAGSAKGVRDGETGWIVCEPTARALAESLCEALGDPARAASRGRSARELLGEDHDWGRLVPGLLAISEAVAR